MFLIQINNFTIIIFTMLNIFIYYCFGNKVYSIFSIIIYFRNIIFFIFFFIIYFFF